MDITNNAIAEHESTAEEGLALIYPLVSIIDRDFYEMVRYPDNLHGIEDIKETRINERPHIQVRERSVIHGTK